MGGLVGALVCGVRLSRFFARRQSGMCKGVESGKPTALFCDAVTVARNKASLFALPCLFVFYYFIFADNVYRVGKVERSTHARCCGSRAEALKSGARNTNVKACTCMSLCVCVCACDMLTYCTAPVYFRAESPRLHPSLPTPSCSSHSCGNIICLMGHLSSLHPP